MKTFKNLDIKILSKQSKNCKLSGDQIIFNNRTKIQIAWIEEKSRLDLKTVDQLQKQSLFYGKEMIGYLKVGSVYIPEKSILSSSDFNRQISKIAKRSLSNRQVALLYYVNDVVIPSDCTEIANEWGSCSSYAIYTHSNKIMNIVNSPDKYNEKIKRAIAKDLQIIKETPGLELNQVKLLELIKRFQLYMD